MFKRNIIIIVLLGFYFLLALAQIYYYPPVWPDEMLFSDPAYNLFHEKHMGTPVLGYAMEGMAEKTFWYPPFYFIMLGAFYKIFNFGILQARIFSVLFGGMLVGVLYYFSKNILKIRPIYIFLVLSWLISDNLFIRNCIIARMDIHCVFFGILGFLFFWMWFFSENKKEIYLYLSGLSLGLCFTTHLVGGGIISIALILTLMFLYLKKRINFTSSIRTVAVFSIPIFFWIIYILADFGLFKAQLSAQLSRKFLSEKFAMINAIGYFFDEYLRFSELSGAFKYLIIIGPITLLLGIFSIIVFFTVFLSKKEWRNSATAVFCAIYFLSSSVIFIFAHEMWYYIYFFPAIYLLMVKLPEINKKIKIILYMAMILLICLNLNLHIVRIFDKHYDYSKIGKALKAKIPAGSRIFIKAAPDPSFLFYKQGYEIYQFCPEGAFDKNIYFSFFKSIDNIILSYFEQDKCIEKYMDENKLDFRKELLRIEGIEYIIYTKNKN